MSIFSDWIKSYGSEEQIERFNSGYLPKKELLDVVEEHIFGKFSALPQLTDEYIESFASRGAKYPGVKYVVRQAGLSSLTANEFKTLKEIELLASEACAKCQKAPDHIITTGLRYLINVPKQIDIEPKEIDFLHQLNAVHVEFDFSGHIIERTFRLGSIRENDEHCQLT